MRPTVTLICPAGEFPQLRSRLLNAGAYREGPYFDRLEVGECSFGVDASMDALDEFEDDEVAGFHRRFGDISVVTLEYSGVACIRVLLTSILSGISGVLDTNYGEVLEFSDVLERFQQDPLWDWRKSVAD